MIGKEKSIDENQLPHARSAAAAARNREIKFILPPTMSQAVCEETFDPIVRIPKQFLSRQLPLNVCVHTKRRVVPVALAPAA
jgi:hypothetical protein